MLTLIQHFINRENLKGLRTQIRKRNVVRKKDLKVRKRFEKKRKEIGKNTIQGKISKISRKKSYRLGLVVRVEICGKRR